MGKIFDSITQQITDERSKIKKIEDYIKTKREEFEKAIQKETDTKISHQHNIAQIFNKSIPVRIGDLLENLKNATEFRVLNPSTCTNILSKGIMGKDSLLENIPEKPTLSIYFLAYENEYKYNRLALHTNLRNMDSLQANGKTLRELATVEHEGLSPDVPTHTRLCFSNDAIKDIIVDVPYVNALNARLLDVVGKSEYCPNSTTENELDEESIME